MSTRGLVQLEDLRRDDVDRASRELADRRRTHEQALAAQQSAAGAHEAALRALAVARESFAAARTVPALRAAEDALRLAREARLRTRERLESSRVRALSTAHALADGEGRVRAGEVARRSVARTLEQRAADVSLRTERRHEDESDDAFRAQTCTRTPVSSARR
jgi:hypothetical protein